MSATIHPVPVEKESISNLHFTKREVVHPDAKALREKLERATTLGNIDHSKVRILFMDDDGHKFTETTIWATSTNHVVLKGGVTIPFSRIVDVKFI